MPINLLDMLRNRVGGLPDGPPDLSNVSIPNPTGPKSIQPKRNLLDLLAGVDAQQGGYSADTLKQGRQAGLLNAGLSLLASGGKMSNYRRPDLGEALQGALQAGQGGYGQVLQAAQGLQQQQKADSLEAAKRALFNEFAPRLAMGGAEGQKAAAELTARASALGVKDIAGALSQFGQQFADKEKKPEPPKYVKVETVDDKGKPVTKYMTEADAAAAGSIPGYVKPENGGNTSIEMARLNLAIRQADAQNINQALDDYKAFTPTIRAAADGYRSLQGIAKAAIAGNQAASIGLLYAYAKVLDPASAVREGEIATLQKIGSYDRRVANWIEMATKGTLKKDQIEQIVQTADSAMESRKQQNNDYMDAARRRGKALGVDVEPFLVNPFGSEAGGKQAALDGIYEQP